MNNYYDVINEYILIPVAHAQSAPQSVIEFVGRINEFFLNPLIILLFSVALITFIWGMLSFFGRKDNTEEVEKGKRHMLWGIIGMAIMVSVFSLMNFVTTTTIGQTVSPSSGGDISNLFN